MSNKSQRVINLQLVGCKDGLGKTSKMPCPSYSLSAHVCHTGKKLAEVRGSTCHDCYALKGRYNYPTVVAAHERRLATIHTPEWAPAMKVLIEETASAIGYFRWHDSGDLQSSEHLDKIAWIARELPNIRFWLPTKEYTLVRNWLLVNDKPENLIIRPSAPMIDGPAVPLRTRDGKMLPVAYVHRYKAPRAQVCPAPSQNGKCGDCRNCWTDEPVSYAWH